MTWVTDLTHFIDVETGWFVPATTLLLADPLRIEITKTPQTQI